MKKWIAWILMFACLFAFAGCEKDEKPEIVGPTYAFRNLTIGDFHSDIPGVYVKVSGIVTMGDQTMMSVVLENETPYSVAYNDDYKIERLENGEWVSCALKEGVGTGTKLEVDSNVMQSQMYIISELFDISVDGTYRFISSCTVDKGDGKEINCVVWSEFTFGE